MCFQMMGGTRTAAITGAWVVSLRIACEHLVAGAVTQLPLTGQGRCNFLWDFSKTSSSRP